MARILIIQPDTILAGQYRERLERSGHEVGVANGAQAAINLTDKQTPELVILELLLQAHSGIEFLYEFRSYPEWHKVPVIILSRMPRRELPASDAMLARLGVVSYLYGTETSLKRLAERVAAAVAPVLP